MAWAPDYVSVIELSEFVRVPDTADDAHMALAIAAASRAVDRTCGRQFGQALGMEARCYTARRDPARDRWSVQIDDLMTSVGLAVAFDSDDDGTYASPITLHTLRPVNAAQKVRPWTELVVRPSSPVQPTTLEAGVQVTAWWGWMSVPSAVKEATLLQASRILSRRDSPYGVTGSPENGGELRLLAKVDPDVEVALSDYKRRNGWSFA